MSYPVIALSTTQNNTASGIPQYSIGVNYVLSLIKAGACPLMIPSNMPLEALQELIPHLDGVLFTGGGDIHPSYYGGKEHPLVSDIEPERDLLEAHLLKEAMQVHLPILGICRGFQVINVYLGGSLFEDIQAQSSQYLKHNYFPGWPRNYLAHQVSLLPGSSLAEILGGSLISVNSLHHQGIDQLSDRLEALGSAPDGILEAYQIRDYPYGLAVQWHPEWLQEDAGMRALFRSFVQAAEMYRQDQK